MKQFSVESDNYSGRGSQHLNYMILELQQLKDPHFDLIFFLQTPQPFIY